jgi:hypothetical protein
MLRGSSTAMNELPPTKIAAIAREAEAHDHEAISEIDAAQKPCSDGGHLITPVEATRIRMRVLKSAVLDSEAASLADQSPTRPVL